MRWPLRYQIMLPMAAVMLATVLAASGLSAYLAARRTRSHIEGQLRDIVRTLNGSSFPLTDAVLRQMRGLSGADFVLQRDDGRVVASSWRLDGAWAPPAADGATSWLEMRLGGRVHVQGSAYFHAVVRLERPTAFGGGRVLHIFYPERVYRRAWLEAVYPPLVLGAAGLVIVILVATVVGSRLVAPMSRLRGQVERIAHGDFSPLPLPRRDDEVRDLAGSVNRMAEMLARYEDQVRRTERLHTLGQLGAALAHQLRNAATGCRMALDLHRRECAASEDCESLDVATRQLAMIEQHLQRLLSLGPERPFRPERFDLTELVGRVVALVLPAAEHRGVTVDWQPPGPMPMVGDVVAIEQLAVNLLLNAVEAAAAVGGSQRGGYVGIHVRCKAPDRLVLTVEDNGLGPPRGMEDKLFDPLVTGKADGIGLGLAVARQVAAQHGGVIRWRRDQKTCFHAELPRNNREPTDAHAVGG